MAQQKIVFNDVEYESVEQMPADVRQQYQRVMALLPDKNGNGVPDVLEQASAAAPGPARTRVTTRTRITVNGKTYNSPGEMPPELRQLYERAMANAGGAPAASEGASAPDHPNVKVTFKVNAKRSALPRAGSDPATTPNGGITLTRVLLALAGLLLVLLVVYILQHPAGRP